MKRSRILRWLLTIPLAAVFLFCRGMALGILGTAHREQQAFVRLAARVETVADAEAPETLEAQVETKLQAESPYQSLKDENPDFYGWISIAGTSIDYPVMYTPEAPEAFSYYQYTDLRDEARFDAYVSGVTREALYATGITPQYGDALLTLSTCSYHAADGRFVVVARRTTQSIPG